MYIYRSDNVEITIFLNFPCFQRCFKGGFKAPLSRRLTIDQLGRFYSFYRFFMGLSNKKK
jgi:hypothetical protein